MLQCVCSHMMKLTNYYCLEENRTIDLLGIQPILEKEFLNGERSMNQLVFKNKCIIIRDEICHFFERGLQKNVLVINKHLNISLFLHFQNHLLETKYVFY